MFDEINNGLDATAVGVYCYIASNAMEAYANVQVLAAALNSKPLHINRAVKKLEAVGCLERKKLSSGNVLYKLND